MAKIKDKDNTIKAKILKCDCPINAKVEDNDKDIDASILNDVVPATTEKKGIIRIATDDEAIEGTSTDIAITPHTLNKVTHYTHVQGIASDTWVIKHNLNKKPSITIVDSADNVVEGAEKYIDENTVEIYFNGAFKGQAYLN